MLLLTSESRRTFKLAEVTKSPVWQLQTPAKIDKAAPTQNIWYPVLETTGNVRILAANMVVQTADETIQMKITIDGEEITGGVAATAATDYGISRDCTYAGGNYLSVDAARFNKYQPYIIEGRIVKVEVRKTTALGAGNLQAIVSYSRL